MKNEKPTTVDLGHLTSDKFNPLRFALDLVKNYDLPICADLTIPLYAYLSDAEKAFVKERLHDVTYATVELDDGEMHFFCSEKHIFSRPEAAERLADALFDTGRLIDQTIGVSCSVMQVYPYPVKKD